MTKRILPPPPGPQWSARPSTPQQPPALSARPVAPSAQPKRLVLPPSRPTPAGATVAQPQRPSGTPWPRHAPPPVAGGPRPAPARGGAVIQEAKGKGKGKGGKGVGGKAEKKEPRIPFPWRFSDKGERALMVERMLVDLIATSVPTKVAKGLTFTIDGKEKSLKSVAITDKRFRNLTKTSKRQVSQVSVMFGLSPNRVAEAAGFEKGSGWEWLHLVAFSFGHQYVSSLSDNSLALFRKTKQQQQIPENLVLGTAAANTAMLEVESAIKASLAGQPDLQLQLWAHATEFSREAEVDGDTWYFKICSEIRYHFRFFKRYQDDDGIERELSTGAIIMTFDPFSHVRPLKTEYSEVHREIVEFSRKLYELANPTQGIRTGWMVGM